MTRTFLIATVAALAITAPAQAQRVDRDAQRAERAEARKAQKAQRAASGQAQPQRIERQRVERPQRVERQRMVERAPRIERQRIERVRPQRMERQRIVERAPRIERQRIERVRPQRAERQRIVERAPRIERQRIERVRPQRVERQRVERVRPAIERRAQRIQRNDRVATQRVDRRQLRQSERLARTQNRIERRNERFQAQATAPVRIADSTRFERRVNRPLRSVGDRIDLRQQRLNLRQQRLSNDWYNDFATQRYQTFYDASPNYFYDYDYDDGYLYQVDRDSYLVTALFPVLGGAFGIGQPLPFGYDSYNVPFGYRSLYYDTPDYYYRYGDGGIYRIDRDTQLIGAVVALLTGQQFGVGQMLPLGYDVYNVPYGYRDMYFDTDDMWYRYDDGYIYGVDPYSRMIESVYPLSYSGYAVGYPAPVYAGYGYPSYAVPYGYQNLYYDAPGYNYYYANNGIYQVDPATQLVSALVALVTGTNLGVGQALPLGYDVYNVPYQYRATYFDTDDMWYRYDDGYIYGVDPYSRVIQSAVPVAYTGYTVGYPVPAAYPGYAVPDVYDDLYLASPDYDYRYFDGGIYAIDPDSRRVEAVAALLTGQNLAVGQMLPVGYDVYNVPYAYRDRYYDSDRYLYRYADGYIYQVDPQTRVIAAVIDAIA